jgi:arsenate reductase
VTPERKVLFVCVENACRSLMAEAFFAREPPKGWSARSAGTEPAPSPNPRTAPMLSEVGLSMPAHPPLRLTEEMVREADRVILMGCLDRPSCPAFLYRRVDEDWDLPDPGLLPDEGFRSVRDEIGRRVGELVRRL